MTEPLSAIVHLPYHLKSEPDSAPQLRPRFMIEGFRALGVEVRVISGPPRIRKRQMRKVLETIRSTGKKPDFLYSEASGWPNVISEGKKYSVHPGLDTNFLKAISRMRIPIGLFYRDVYHRDPTFFDVPWRRRILRRVLADLATRDLHNYNSYVDRLYLPSTRMADFVPEFRGQIDELPPGADIKDARRKTEESALLRLVYVGGLGPLYQLHEIVAAVRENTNVSLTISTRENDWEAVKDEYSPLLGDNIEIVHKNNAQLHNLYQHADIALLTVAPSQYRTFAYPVKLFEYLGAGLPIVATEGTLAAEYIKHHGVGWSVAYDKPEIQLLLDMLSAENQPCIAQVKQQVIKHRDSVSWTKRAQQVVDDLLCN